MKPTMIKRRVVHRIVTTAVWILIGSLALAGTSQAAAAFGSRSDRCVAPHTCASQLATGPSLVLIDTGAPDGRMAMASRPPHASLIEIEAADDFIATTTVRIDQATFTGLLPSGAPLSSIQDVQVEIYRVFPLDSANPPSGHVPTRVNSPSDVDFVSRAESSGDLSFTGAVLSSTFHASNSVLNGIHPIPNQHTGGEGSVTGEEVQFSATLTVPIVLAADHYFFIPKVQLSSGNFFWLSGAGPAVFTGDLQAWIRNADLDPDWLRVGTDIVGGTTPPKFNGSFSLTGSRALFLPAIFR